MDVILHKYLFFTSSEQNYVAKLEFYGSSALYSLYVESQIWPNF